MKTRIIAGAVFTVVVALTFFLAPTAVTAVTMAFMTVLASYELLLTTGLVKYIRLNVYSALMGVGIVLWSYFGGGHAHMVLGILLYFMLLGSELLLSSGKLPVAKIGYCLMSGFLVPFLLTSLLRIRSWENGRLMLLVPFILAYFSDTGAYFVGVTCGKHKMCPNISPKKSWEGFAGGIAVAVLGMIGFGLILDLACDYEVNYLLCVVYGLAGSLGSVFGDLTMSVIKRQTGIKDYGKLIPGHGGILDRFDSVMITAPLTEALLLILPFVV
jgi:phosphatidate cytidylyltransferase